MTTAPTTDLTATIDAHLAAYANPDGAARRDRIAAVWTPDGELVDPPMAANGTAQIDALAAAVLDQFPGHTFRRTSAIDEHHGFARYSWDLVSPAGTVSVAGTDVAEVDDAGRLVRIIGFFGPLGDVAG